MVLNQEKSYYHGCRIIIKDRFINSLCYFFYLFQLKVKETDKKLLNKIITGAIVEK